MVDIQVNDLLYKNVKLIFFDKDGTLTNSNTFWSAVIKLRARALCDSLSLPDHYYDSLVFTMGLNEHTNKLLPKGPIAIKSRAEVIDIVHSFLKEHFPQVSLTDIRSCFDHVQNQFQKSSIQYINPIPTAVSKVKLFNSIGLKLVLLTSDSIANANLALNQLDIFSCFHLVIGRDSGFGNKVTGQSAQYACNELSIPPLNSIAIGDAPTDFYMAQNANLAGSILTATGQIPFNDLKTFSSSTIENLDNITLHY